MQQIHTVTGPILPEDLGLTLIHEHLLIGYPGWFMDARAAPFKRAEALARGVARLEELRSFGVRTFVDPCPMDLGRDVEFMAEVSARSGVQIICATGAYKQNQGITYTFAALPVEEIEQIYLQELTYGIGTSGIRAGLVKVASGAHAITEYERKLMLAAARAAMAVGCPILTHTDEATCGLEQIDLLTGVGLPSHRILVGHSDGRADHAYHRALAERGAYVGFDRFGIVTLLSDEQRMEGVLRMVEAGFVRSLCLSHDATCAAWLGRPSFDGKRVLSPEKIAQYLPNWEPTHLFKRILPKLREQGLPEAAIETMLLANPARYFRGEHSPLVSVA